MRLCGPYHYRVTVRDDGGYNVRNQNGGETFLAPATERVPKLYAFSSAGRLLYIGQTVQSMAARMRLGFQADGMNGYYGFAWRDALPEADLHIWCLDQAGEEEVLALECIEAEVVFRCRSVCNQWPSYQTEIHFHKSSDEHRDLAAQIFALFSQERR